MEKLVFNEVQDDQLDGKHVEADHAESPRAGGLFLHFVGEADQQVDQARDASVAKRRYLYDVPGDQGQEGD